jgi:dihydrofolate reductase
MRKVTYSAAASLDGYIAGPEEAIDWIRSSDDSADILKRLWKGVDTILMGRKTWDFAQRRGGGPRSASLCTIVFSRTMKDPPDGAELVRDDAVGFVRALKQGEGGGIFLMGGGELASALIEGGVVDEIGVSVHPLLLGDGVPLFRPMQGRVELAPIEQRPIANGCVYVRYEVLNAPTGG